MALSQDLLEILACPQCKQAVEPSPDGAWLICTTCGLRYPPCRTTSPSCCRTRRNPWRVKLAHPP